MKLNQPRVADALFLSNTNANNTQEKMKNNIGNSVIM